MKLVLGISNIFVLGVFVSQIFTSTKNILMVDTLKVSDCVTSVLGSV